MGRYWLMDRHEGEGPSALVETDGSMRIIDVLRFGPGITAVDAQQKVWDDVMGRVAPSMKPFANASTVKEEGVAPHDDLMRGDADSTRRSGRGNGNRGGSAAGRSAGGAKRSGSRGRG
jgi:hypothetical protein